jgi:hypothetical protein
VVEGVSGISVLYVCRLFLRTCFRCRDFCGCGVSLNSWCAVAIFLMCSPSTRSWQRILWHY